MGFYFRKVNTEATIVCVLNAEANPVKEQKHYNGIGPCNGSQSKKTSNKTVLGSYITIIEVGYSAFFVSLNFRLFVGCLTFSCCLRLSFVVSYCRQQVTPFPLIPNILSCITFAVESSNMLSDFRFKSNF